MSTISASTTTTTAYVVTADTTGALVLQTGASPTTAVTIDTSQNVGIGVTSPTTKLDLSGNTGLNVAKFQQTGSYQPVFMTSTTNLSGVMSETGNQNGLLMNSASNYTTLWTGGAERMRIDSSGNVGIGTSSPTNLGAGRTSVDINGSTDSILWMRSGGTASGYLQATTSLINLVGATNIPIAISAQGTAYTQFITGGTERARIDSSGNLLLNTTSVAGYQNTSSFLFNSVNGAGYANHVSGTGSGAVYWGFGYNGSGIGSITQSGTTAVLYNVMSDQRAKENIVDADSASTLIDALQVRKFDWKTDNTHQRYGFIAQELVTVAPEAVHQPADPDEMMAVDYSKLVPMLVKAMQEQQALITALQADITALKEKVGA